MCMDNLTVSVEGLLNFFSVLGVLILPKQRSLVGERYAPELFELRNCSFKIK